MRRLTRMLPSRLRLNDFFQKFLVVRPPKCGIFFGGGVVLFALFSFLFDQIFSEKVQNVANNLKILCKKFGVHILDLLDEIPFF